MNTLRAIGVTTAIGAGALVLNRVRRARRAIDFAGRSVLIFGGSRGLGLVLARELAEEGAHVTVAARDGDELERARLDIAQRGHAVHTVSCDIRDRQQVEQAIEYVIRHRGGLDVLINDAGIIQVGPMAHMTVADFENAMATHFWGPLFSILAALPHMRRGGAKRIVNISSIGGKIAVPHLLPYSASKFALTGLSEGLSGELARDGFFVTTVCPGLMRVGSSYNATFKGDHRHEFEWFHVSSSIPGLTIHARRAARQIIEACRYGDPELIITMPARLAVLMKGISPGLVATVLATANRFLPTGGQPSSDEERSGWQSVTTRVPSALTTLNDRASRENNELPLR